MRLGNEYKAPLILLRQFSAIVTGTLLLSSCGLRKPEAPSWTVDLLVPLASRHVDGPYIAAHAGSDYLTWQADSGLVWKIAADLDTVRLGGRIKTTPPAASGAFALGSVEIGEGAAQSCTISLEDVTPLSAGAVPELTAQLDAIFPQATAFDSLSGASGILRLEIENELGVTVDQVTVILYAGAALPVLSLTIAGPIPTGSAQHVDHLLSGMSLGDDWTLTLGFHTPGGTVLSAADKYIAVTASFPEGVTASYARAAIAATSKQYSDSLILSDTHDLTSAVIAEGEMVLSWTNDTPLPVTVLWQAPELMLDGAPFSGQATLAPWSSSLLPIDLAGVEYTSNGRRSSALINATVQSAGSSGQTVEITPSQSIGYNLTWSEVSFSAASGNIVSTQFSTGDLSASVEWDGGLEDAGLDGWQAFLLLSSSLPLAAQINGHVTSNTGLDLPFNGTIPAAGSSPVVVRVPLENADIPLRPLPSEVRFAGTVSFGGGNETVSVYASDFVSASVELSAPAHMYVDSVRLDIEPSSVALSSADYGDRTGRLLNATVALTVINRFPMGGQFTLRVAADSVGVTESEARVFGPSTLLPAATDANGNAVSATTTELTYTLDSADLTLFERDLVWFSESLVLLGPGQGQPARISAEDVLDWHAQARMEVKLDGDVRPWEN